MSQSPSGTGPQGAQPHQSVSTVQISRPQPIAAPTLQPAAVTRAPVMMSMNPGTSVPPRPNPVAPGGAPAPLSPPGARPAKAGDQSLELTGDHPGAAAAPSKIRAFGVGDTAKPTHTWKRAPHFSGTGAVRVRTFHGRLSDQGVEYLDNAINEWLDNHPDIEVKFVTSTVGIFEGKVKDLALVLNVWY